MKKEKVIHLEDRVPTIKKERRRKANKSLIIYICIFFFLALIILYFQSSLSKVKEIEVQGVRHLTKQEIVDWSHIEVRDDFWGTSTDDVRANLKDKSPYLKDITLERKFPTTIMLHVEEWDQVGTLYDGKDFKILLENGALVTSGPFSEKHYEGPVFMNWSDQSKLKKLLSKLKNVPQSIVSSISEVHYLEGENEEPLVKLYMIEGFEVRAAIRDFDKKMKYYPSILEQLDPKKKGIIHLEVGAYFKEYEKEKPATTDEKGVKNEANQ